LARLIDSTRPASRATAGGSEACRGLPSIQDLPLADRSKTAGHVAAMLPTSRPAAATAASSPAISKPINFWLQGAVCRSMARRVSKVCPTGGSTRATPQIANRLSEVRPVFGVLSKRKTLIPVDCSLLARTFKRSRVGSQISRMSPIHDLRAFLRTSLHFLRIESCRQHELLLASPGSGQ
jgi:hypothetical protein